MPLQRRLPKIGFKSRSSKFNAEVRLSELNTIVEETVDIKVLIASNIVPIFTKRVKIIKSGVLNKPFIIKGIAVTVGAKESIEAAGGKVEG